MPETFAVEGLPDDATLDVFQRDDVAGDLGQEHAARKAEQEIQPLPSTNLEAHRLLRTVSRRSCQRVPIRLLNYSALTA